MLYTCSAQCIPLMQVLLDMLLSWKRNGTQHNPNTVSPKQRRCTQSKKFRVLKCSIAAHLIRLFIPSYACTLHKIWSSQGKGMKATQWAFFILIFVRGPEESNFCRFLWNSDRGDPWVSPSKGRARATLPGSSQVSIHLGPHTPQHVPTVRCTPWGKKQGLWRTQDLQKGLPRSQNSWVYLLIWAKRALLPNKCSPLVVASQLWIT